MSSITSSGTPQASVAEVKAETAVKKYVSPELLKESPGACKAWVVYKTTTSTTITSSWNVSSLTDNGVGDTTINFTTAMPSANYAVCGSSQSFNTFNVTIETSPTTLPTTTSVRIRTNQFNFGAQDSPRAYVAILGG